MAFICGVAGLEALFRMLYPARWGVLRSGLVLLGSAFLFSYVFRSRVRGRRREAERVCFVYWHPRRSVGVNARLH